MRGSRTAEEREGQRKRQGQGKGQREAGSTLLMLCFCVGYESHLLIVFYAVTFRVYIYICS